MLNYESISISSILKDENKLTLIKETFDAVFKYFESILEEMIKIKNNLLSSKIESFIDGNNANYYQIKSIILDKITKNDDCSIYYTGLKFLLL